MKKLLPLLLLPIICATSCKQTWSSETKDSFYQACTEEAVHWAGTQDRAKTYCDCVFAKMVAKYPHEEDALEHIDSLAKDPDLIKCKEEVQAQTK
jgi:hypothetical protein